MHSKPLPDHWVQKIFATMQGNYGSRFLNMWKTGQVLPDGSDAGVVNAMKTWGEKLGSYVSSPETIKLALEHLPSDPPSLPQFQELLRAYRVEPRPALPQKLSEEEVRRRDEIAKENIRKLKEMLRGKP